MARRKLSGVNIQAAHRRAHIIAAGRKGSHVWRGLIAEITVARAVIKKCLLAHEPELKNLSFMKYRYLSAYQKTELFTRLYETEFREKHAKYFDMGEADRARPIDPDFARNSKTELSSLWRARQEADSLGIPYGTFIRQAMESAINRWNDKRVPRPNQLWGKSQLMDTAAEWKKLVQIGGHLPRDDWDSRFKAEAFRGEPPQDACLKLIESHVLSAHVSDRPMRLANFLRQGWIGLDEVTKRFGGNLATEAARGVDDTISVSGNHAGAFPAYIPACLGLVQEQDASGCVNCSFRSACAKATEIVNSELVGQFGSTDPRLATQRQDGRERVRRHRERKRLKVSSTL